MEDSVYAFAALVSCKSTGMLCRHCCGALVRLSRVPGRYQPLFGTCQWLGACAQLTAVLAYSLGSVLLVIFWYAPAPPTSAAS